MTLDPTVPSAQININDYNTMQQMFNTSMGMQQFNYSVHPPVMTNVTPVTNPYQINTTFNSPVIN